MESVTSCNFAAHDGVDNSVITLDTLTKAKNGTLYHPLIGGDAVTGGLMRLLPTEKDLGIDVNQDGFIDNNSEYDTSGGAIFNGSNLHLNAVHFEGNSGGHGAAISSAVYPLTAVNSSFVENNWNDSGDNGAIRVRLRC